MTTIQTAPVGSWLRVADDLQNVLISHDWVYPVHVFVGASAPDPNSAYHVCRSDRPFSLSGITGQDVYIRSGTDRPLDVVVTAV
ncbi:hypothetical protein [Pseudorhizobium pelagicum]|uniref:Uncharacterized protein n=1 Tax=Pseudorhizobium pelagicum TaxID=1509405 RepID=A0A922T911_9HYPH|nr:hypothetical protein [Pseudorhizobium pelagicum]KEQ05756.1 hypothetical protein GV67_04200 [Pseudorhizobium pelagicum]KEQ06436.1 hypothetical protein GV68_07195 [Pseudorhizobium pelagicum]